MSLNKGLEMVNTANRKKTKKQIEAEFQRQLKKRTRTYVYLRVSTDKQENEKFVFQIKQYCKRMGFTRPITIKETVSGKKKIEERQIGCILEREDCLRIIVPEQSRLGRSSLESQKIWKICQEKGIQLHCIKENLALDPQDMCLDAKFRFDINAAFAEKEVGYISVRTKEGMAYARDVLGKRLGKPLDKYKLSLEGKVEEICDMFEEGMTKKDIAEHYKVCPRTLYRFIDTKDEEITIYCRNKDYGRKPNSGRRTGGNGRRRGTGNNQGRKRRRGRGRN